VLNSFNALQTYLAFHYPVKFFNWYIFVSFLADRTNGRAIATVLRLSSVV